MILGNSVVGPFVVNGNWMERSIETCFKTFLNHYQISLKIFKKNSQACIWTRRCATLLHQVWGFLHQRLSGGRCGSIEWPTRSPILSPLDFLLLGVPQNQSVWKKTSKPSCMKNRNKKLLPNGHSRKVVKCTSSPGSNFAQN